MKYKTLKTVLLALLMLTAVREVKAQDESRLIMTIGCLSDPHADNNYKSKGYLRASIEQTINIMKEKEDIDVLVLGGDYTGGANGDGPQSVWNSLRSLLVSKTEAAFKNGKTPFVVYANGNHEYMFGDSYSYNSGDYYSVPMKKRIGELTPVNEPTEKACECFYEWTTDKKLNLLAAYHYNINGIDFVVLNTGKNQYTSDTNYFYSKESVAWVDKKLDAIYGANPDKTVFFVLHFPFGDSNSISSSDYGMRDVASEKSSATALKKALAKHPNIIMLYGHDHKADKAYTRERTLQRITRYNTSGVKIGTTDTRHIDAGERYENAHYITLKNKMTQGWLYSDYDNNLQTGRRTSWKITANSDYTYTLSTFNGLETRELGYSNKSVTTNSRSDIWFYQVNGSTATKVKSGILESGKYYLIVCKGTSTYYLLNMGSQDRRKALMTGKGALCISDDTNTITLDNGTADIYCFQVEDYTLSEPQADDSFVSAFMGSMDYWNNIPNGNPGNTEMTDAKKHVFQALMIYVYSDKIVFKMKNFGKTGTFSSFNFFYSVSVTVNEDLAEYTIIRNVEPDTIPCAVGRISGKTGLVSDTETATDAIYDVYGRKADTGVSPDGGIYIIDGKKRYLGFPVSF